MLPGRNHHRRRQRPFFRTEGDTKVDRAAGLRRAGAVSLRKQLGKCERRERHRIEERMHRHRDKNGTAPFVGNGKTTSQNEQGSERREMSVRGGKKQRVEGNSEKTAEITLEYAVEEKDRKSTRLNSSH